MIVPRLIERKRNGGHLEPAEIRELVMAFSEGSVPDYQMAAFLMAVYYRGQPAQEFRHRRLAIDNDYLLMENFVQAIETGSRTIVDARAGRAICATVSAALESARSGQVVEVG